MPFTLAAETITQNLRWSLAYAWGQQNPDLFPLIYVLCLLVCMVIPYLLGSMNFALIFSKLFRNDDIRKYGSGNAGMTNMLRTYGKGMAVATLLCDMAKGAVSVILGYLFLEVDGAMIGGLFCILGHVFPCFYKFKGGKGVATATIVIMITSPFVGLILLGLFVGIVAVTKYISLGSVMCMFLYPVILWAFNGVYEPGLRNAISVLIAILIIYMHRSNIKRLYEGKENKLSLKKHKKETPKDSVQDEQKQEENK